MMTRDEAINVISALYPPDSDYPAVARNGKELLAQAKKEVGAWKLEPTDVLVRFAELCLEKELTADDGIDESFDINRGLII